MSTKQIVTVKELRCLASHETPQIGVVSRGALGRLAESSIELLDDAEFKFQISQFASSGQYLLRGEANTRLTLMCHRCLSHFEYELKATIYLVLVETQALADSVSSEYEVLVLDEGKLCLNTLIEEELLLSLPIAPKHDEGSPDCGVEQENLSELSPSLMESPSTHNPFNVLNGLKV